MTRGLQPPVQFEHDIARHAVKVIGTIAAVGVVFKITLLGFGFQVQHYGTSGWNRFKNKTLGVS